MAKNFEFLEHTADIKFRAWGKTLGEAFSGCALAVSKTLCRGKIKMKKSYSVKAHGKDNESLLYNFIEELLYLLDTEHFIPAKVKSMKIKDGRLTARVVGDDIGKYEIKNYIKSPTYNDMQIKKKGDNWTAQMVVDV
jgi:SHS2 domain-containing protein